MQILKASKKDLINISSLAVQVWLDTYAIEGIRKTFSNYIWNELTPENFEMRHENPDREFYKIEENSHLIGFVEINYNSPYENGNNLNLEIEKLYIQNQFCGKGFGGQVINFINSLCVEKNIDQFWLSVYEKNSRAIKFYYKHNFVEIGEVYFNLESEKHRNLVLKRSVI